MYGNIEPLPSDDEDGRRSRDGDDEREELDEPELFDLPNDAYSFIFLSPAWTQGFVFGLYVFLLKMGLYTFLIIDAYDNLRQTKHDETPGRLLAAQCVILPVAVAMQGDLRSTYTILSNVKYSHLVTNVHPHATKLKYYFSNLLRGVDGMYSLIINFGVMLMADSAAGLFLNFAALEFLQTIDDMAFKLAKEGFFTPTLEDWANHVEEMKLPKRKGSNFMTKLDSVLFIATYENFLAAWFILKIFNWKKERILSVRTLVGRVGKTDRRREHILLREPLDTRIASTKQTFIS